MSDNYIWQPVARGTLIHRNGDLGRFDRIVTPTESGLVVESYDGVYITDIVLPDDLRLCRRVPAQGVPVEVWHAIHEALEDYREDAQRNACPCADCTNERSAAEKALHWLHAQPQPAAPANLNLVCDGHVEADNE